MKFIYYIPVSFALIGIFIAPAGYWCIYLNGYCSTTEIRSIYAHFLNPIFNSSLFFLPVAFLLILLPRRVFNAWLKFAAWAIPLAIIFIWTTPVNYTGLGLDFFPFYRDDAARLAGAVFAGASLLVTISRWILTRRYEKGHPQAALSEEAYVRERLMPLSAVAAVASFIGALVLAVVPGFFSVRGAFQMILALFLISFLFGAHSLWRWLQSVRISEDGVGRLLRRGSLLGGIGFAVSLATAMFEESRLIAMAAAGLFALIACVSLAIHGGRDLIQKQSNFAAIPRHTIATAFILSGTLAAVILTGVAIFYLSLTI